MAKVSNETRLLVALVKERAGKEKSRLEDMKSPMRPSLEQEKAAFRHGADCVLGMLDAVILELERR